MLKCTGRLRWVHDLTQCTVRVGYVPAGEGYECTVTVDDEDSKVIIFDNWKQVGHRPSAPQSLCLVYLVQFRPTASVFVNWWPLALLKSHLTFFLFWHSSACTWEMETAMWSIPVMGNSFVCTEVLNVCSYFCSCVQFYLCAVFPAIQGALQGKAVLTEVLSLGEMDLTLFWRGLKLLRLCMSSFSSFVIELNWPCGDDFWARETRAASDREWTPCRISPCQGHFAKSKCMQSVMPINYTVEWESILIYH